MILSALLVTATLGLALAGYLAGQAILAAAGRRIQESVPEDAWRALTTPRLVFAALPLAAVVFTALVVSVNLDTAEPTVPLLTMGAVAGVAAAVRGFLAARGLGALAGNPEAFGKLLVLVTIPETPVVFHLVIEILAVGVDATDSLLIMAAAAIATLLGMALVAGSKVFPQGIEDPTKYGRTLVLLVAPEALAVLGVAGAILMLPGGTA